MHELPKNLKELQTFAEEEGRTCAGALSSRKRKSLSLVNTTNQYFTFYKGCSEEAGQPYCDVFKEGREIFEKHFRKGFHEFE